MKEKQTRPVYVEPVDYFPEDLRRKFKLGEFSEVYKAEESDDEESKDVKEDNSSY